jgi:hypothetical protein
MASDAPLLPEVVDDSGKPLVGPDLDAVLKRVTEMATLANLARIRKNMEDRTSVGWTISYNEVVTTRYPPGEGSLDLPSPAQSISVTNDGLNPVLVGLNENTNPHPLNPGEVQNVDFQAHRLKRIYLQAVTGNTNVRAIVKG